MLKNSQILPIFGLGLILSTSPLFTLLDSSLVSPETVKLEGEKEEGEVNETEESTESSSTTTTSTEEPSLDSSTTEDTHSKDDSPKPEDQVDSSAQQPEPKESTKDTTSEAKETTELTPSTHSQVTKSVTPATTITTTVTTSTSTSTEPFKVASTVPANSSPKTTEVSSTTPTNRVSQPSKKSKSSVSQKVGWKRREYIRDYKHNEKTNTQGLRKVLLNNDDSKFLYSIDKDVDFSIPDNLQANQFQKIPIKNIHISLFKTAAWSSTKKSVDEYERIEQGKVKELFDLVESKKGQEKKKLRQLLVSLSNRRVWSFHEKDTTYKSELKAAEIIWNNTVNDSELNFEIKYFEKFEELKRYIDYKMDLCSKAAKGQCTASPDELTIIDQDKKSFFEDKKK